MSVPPRLSHPLHSLPSQKRWNMAESVPSAKQSMRFTSHETHSGRVMMTPPRLSQVRLNAGRASAVLDSSSGESGTVRAELSSSAPGADSVSVPSGAAQASSVAARAAERP